MTDEQHCTSTSRNVLHLVQALLLKRVIANRQHFVNDENLRLQMRGDRKREAHVHAAAVAFDGCVDKLLDFGKRDDLVKLALDLVARHTENRSVEKNVFATAELRMKACAHFEQTADAPIQFSTTNRWFGNTRKDL